MSIIKTKNLLFLKDSAIVEVLKELKQMGYRWDHYKLINHNRYAVIFGTNDSQNIALTLKKEPFFNFGHKFYYLGESGVGDSINCEHLKEFLKYNVKFIYLKFRDGKLYCISLEDFLKKSHKWTQKEGTEVRSISIHHYKRVNDWL